jgi:hypothetical protein
MMKTMMGWTVKAGLSLGVIFMVYGCSINRNPVAPMPNPEIYFDWTFSGSAEGFTGEEYSEACSINTGTGNRTDSRSSITRYPGNLYVYMSNATPALTGGGWFWGGWFKTINASVNGTNLIGDGVGSPYVKIRVRSTNDYAQFLPRKIEIVIKYAGGGSYTGISADLVNWKDYSEFEFRPPAAVFEGMKTIYIGLDNNIHSAGDYFGYIIDEITVGLK